MNRRLTAKTSQTSDSFASIFVLREAVQTQNLLERLQSAALDDRKSIQCKMGNQPPLQAAADGRANGGCGLRQATSLHRWEPLALKLPPLLLPDQARNEIAVRTRDCRRDQFRGRQSRAEFKINEREIHFRSFIALAKRRTPLCVPIALGFGPVISVAKRVKRFIHLGLLRIRSR